MRPTATHTDPSLTLVRTGDLIRIHRIARSRRTLYNWIRRGQFPPPEARLGRDNVWRLATVNAWLAERLGPADEAAR